VVSIGFPTATAAASANVVSGAGYRCFSVVSSWEILPRSY
jgi:archaellum component FlaF (FlaF/FlaG flagellin family)